MALVLAFFAAAAAAEEDSEGYAVVSGPCDLSFPADHGAHPGFRTEWWYYTGNLEAADGRPFGFQLTVFRRQIRPPHAREQWPDPASPWRTEQIYLGHFAITDISGKTYHYDETMARGALEMAGVRKSGEAVTVFLKGWRIELRPESHRLAARAEGMSLALSLTPVKEPVLHGDGGYSLKGDTPERASCYYSFTRLKTEGEITHDGRTFTVSGLSWMDHEFSTAPLQPGIVGWDWFSLQMDNGTELMVFLLREEDGGLNRASSGTFVDAAGRGHHLGIEDFQIEVFQHWQSPHSKAVYPAGWRIDGHSPNLRLRIEPNLAAQELRTPTTTGVTYWEGSVALKGTFEAQPVSGKGYVELTGYAGAFEGDL